MKVLELFSGIGGMHYALKAANVQSEVIAIEINTNANQVYQLNFPSTKLLQKNILSVKAEDINSMRPELLLMSPPCQPFTRVGLKKDLDDSRADPIKHILKLLHDISSLNYIMVENVKGFENSEARNKLVMCLQGLNFNIREHLISPYQLGIPNMRTRYYLLAKRQPLKFCYEPCRSIEEIPDEGFQILDHFKCIFPEIKLIKDILEVSDEATSIYQDHLLPSSLLGTRAQVLDIVTGDDVSSCCFTKSYGCYAKGTGSVYCPYEHTIKDEALKKHTHDSLRSLNLRFFTPKEVARLMCFPEDFKFPQHFTRKQKYMLLGNSVNIKVVALLIKLMLNN